MSGLHERLGTYERIDAVGDRYYDGVAAERDLKALYAEVIDDQNENVNEVLDIDPLDPMNILAAALTSDTFASLLAAARAEGAEKARAEDEADGWVRVDTAEKYRARAESTTARMLALADELTAEGDRYTERRAYPSGVGLRYSANRIRAALAGGERDE